MSPVSSRERFAVGRSPRLVLTRGEGSLPTASSPSPLHHHEMCYGEGSDSSVPVACVMRKKKRAFREPAHTGRCRFRAVSRTGHRVRGEAEPSVPLPANTKSARSLPDPGPPSCSEHHGCAVRVLSVSRGNRQSRRGETLFGQSSPGVWSRWLKPSVGALGASRSSQASASRKTHGRNESRTAVLY